LEGYRSLLTEGDSGLEEELVWLGNKVTESAAHHMSKEEADTIVDELVIGKDANAIIAMNDFWAARFINALKRRGYRVPEDVAVAGYDNLEIGTYIEPELTTLDPMYYEVAKAAMDLLMELIQNENVPVERRAVNVVPRMVARGSA
jgi:DNA-binding LacI/PurR family transcriptional regulator